MCVSNDFVPFNHLNRDNRIRKEDSAAK